MNRDEFTKTYDFTGRDRGKCFWCANYISQPTAYKMFDSDAPNAYCAFMLNLQKTIDLYAARVDDDDSCNLYKDRDKKKKK